STDNIRSNIFDRNSGAGIHTTAASPDIDYNNVFSNTPNYAGTAGAGANDTAGQPIYRNPSAIDYHLSASSPGADVGDPDLPPANIDHDIDGDIRPTNGGPDMGADEINKCLIRVNGTLFGVFQDAINYAEKHGYPDIEIARGACRGVKSHDDTGTLQVGYISQDLNIIGSLSRGSFSYTGDFYDPDIGISSVIDAQGEGRVIVIAKSATVTFEHVALVNGNAFATDSNDNGGGVYNADGGHFHTSEAHTCANTAENGGGYYGASGTYAYFSGAGTGGCRVAQFNDNDQFTGHKYYLGNIANDGAGFYVPDGAQVDITNHGIDGNFAVNNGGGIYNNGDMTIINGVIWFNSAIVGDGGGVYNSGRLELFHNTIRNNAAGSKGGAVFNNDGAELNINSTIVYTNTAASGGGGVDSPDSGTSSYNNFFDNSPVNVSGFPLGNNSRVGDPGLDGYELEYYSRNIDAADPALLKLSVPIDFDANLITRPDGDEFDNYNYPHGEFSDIGASEYAKFFSCDIQPNSQGATVSPDDTIIYTVEIHNIGNFTDTITVTVVSQTQEWG
ncbi:MAG: hypothetical protein GY803_29485, partial [Chloroflexi bacterium]|nr:hypothetical protein [Chloroflexota bacterium]